MMAAVTESLTTAISWVGTVVTALVGESGQLSQLLPLFAIGIGISAIMVGVKVIKGFTWGA